MDGVTGLQRICTPCASITSRTIVLNKAFADVGARLHSMAGAKLNVGGQYDTLDYTLEYCKAALNPLQNKLIEYQKKQISAEAKALDLELRMRSAQELANSIGKQLHTLVGSDKSQISLPPPSSNLMRLLEFCNELVRPLSQEREKQTATSSRAALAEAAVARAEKERVRLESLLSEAKAFCKGACERWSSMKIDFRLDVQPSSVEPSSEGNEGNEHPQQQCWANGEELYCESSAKSWEQDTTHCAICKSEFGMIALKRRHHCRICGQCVCSACSPSTVQLKGYAALERACTPCISNSQRAPEMRTIAIQLATRMSVVCGLKAPVASQFGSLAEALAFCETAFAPIESLLGHDGGGDSRKAPDGEAMQLQVVEARAESLKLKRELALTAGELCSVKSWSRWVHESATTLSQQLESIVGRSTPRDILRPNSQAILVDDVESVESGNPFKTGEVADNVVGSTNCANPFKDEGENPFDDTPHHESDKGNPFADCSSQEAKNPGNPFALGS